MPARNTTTIHPLEQFLDGVTFGQTPLSRYAFAGFLSSGLIRRSGVAKTGQRGRPAHVYTLTSKGKRRLAQETS